MTTFVKKPDNGSKSNTLLTQGLFKAVLGKRSQWCVGLSSQEANGADAGLWLSEQRFNKDKERKTA